MEIVDVVQQRIEVLILFQIQIVGHEGRKEDPAAAIGINPGNPAVFMHDFIYNAHCKPSFHKYILFPQKKLVKPHIKIRLYDTLQHNSICIDEAGA